ncbi:MAG: sodium/solute symporter, partial [Planctomycetota bacterium]
MNLTVLLIAGAYLLASLALGLWVGRREKNVADDYFLAGRKLPWYAVALSMTGSNIGTEHFIGMVGTAYAFGLAPAVFEWNNWIAYSILAWIFLPFFFRKKLYTIPEFLERRYNSTTREIFAGFSLLHMVAGVLAPALYAGGRIVYEMALPGETAVFDFGFMGCVLLIAGVTAAYCIYGGLLSVVWTDVLQVAVLVTGGLVLVVVGVHAAGGLEAVVEANVTADATRGHIFQAADHPVAPWTGVATIWFTLCLWYVGTNQFYIQRCLGARSEWDAKMGVFGCALIKWALPLIIVFPGMIAFALYGPDVPKDSVYIRMVNELLPPVGQGVLLAALIAAIMSTVSSVLNSASTIWSIDFYHRLINREASEAKLVSVGRWSTFTIICIGTVLAPVLLKWEGGIFIWIQDMAALFAPPIAVVFLAAFLWPRAHGRAATITLLFGIGCGIVLIVLTQVYDESLAWLAPLLNRAAVSWFLCAVVLAVTTVAVPMRVGEEYDHDAIWNTRWARLPECDRS